MTAHAETASHGTAKTAKRVRHPPFGGFGGSPPGGFVPRATRGALAAMRDALVQVTANQGKVDN